jgi:3-hydroxyanthranilate 3,4-dioxygenase
MALVTPINFTAWIDAHRHLFKPPVGNKMVWENQEFIVMLVGGPNARKDYHHDEGAEFFYQLEGDITLKVIDDGKFIDVPIREGEIYLLPPRVLHSPQRPANTLGLVMERKRHAHELDGFMWFCESCGTKLYEEFLHVSNIESQLPPIFKRFFESEPLRTCTHCGTVMLPPQKAS